MLTHISLSVVAREQVNGRGLSVQGSANMQVMSYLLFRGTEFTTTHGIHKNRDDLGVLFVSLGHYEWYMFFAIIREVHHSTAFTPLKTRTSVIVASLGVLWSSLLALKRKMIEEVYVVASSSLQAKHLNSHVGAKSDRNGVCKCITIRDSLRSVSLS